MKVYVVSWGYCFTQIGDVDFGVYKVVTSLSQAMEDKPFKKLEGEVVQLRKLDKPTWEYYEEGTVYRIEEVQEHINN